MWKLHVKRTIHVRIDLKIFHINDAITYAVNYVITKFRLYCPTFKNEHIKMYHEKSLRK